MKTCPNCQTHYTDDSLRFCLQDGSPLDMIDESETVVRGRPASANLRENLQNSPYSGQADQKSGITRISGSRPGQKKQSTAMVVIITAILTVVVVGAGIGAWLYSRNGESSVAKKTNNSANNAIVSNLRNSSTPSVSPTSSADIGVSNNTENIPPSKPASDNTDREQIKQEVSDTIDEWASASESGDLDLLMYNYAGTVDYYKTRGAGAGAVRRDKQRAFGLYDSINFNISNISITPNSSDTATAVFDKEWNFEGAKNSTGKVRSQLQLRKENGKWVISGERDLKVYYVD